MGLVNWLRNCFLRAVDPSELKEGDHIFAYRAGGTYSHHGIFVGGVYVIHFYPTEKEKSAIEGQQCPECGYRENEHLGVVKTCLNCFLTRGKNSFLPAGTSLYRCQYEASFSGTCSSLVCREAKEVVKTAYDLHTTNGFGKYSFVFNNCEDFATFCKTGTHRSSQVETQTTTLPIMAAGLAASVIISVGYYAKLKIQQKRKKYSKLTEK